MRIDWEQIKRELIFSAARSGGAGGQHVNKRNTKASLRWNALRSQAYADDEVQNLVINKLANKLTQSGELLVTSERFRTQEQNREDALKRLLQLIRATLKIPRKRKKTALPYAKKQARVDAKKRASGKKSSRRKISPSQDEHY